VLELTEEPYDGPAGAVLIQELLADINERYRDWAVGLTDEEIAAADHAYLAEVTPDAVQRLTGAFVVARLDGELAGCGAVRSYVPYHDDLPAEDGVAEIKRMYTRAGARRRGVSRAVLQRLEEIAVELGYHRLVLETGSPQPEAIALYEGSGWHRIEPYGHYRDEDTSICFAKDLPPS
jgi:GNAT superfamily N-acetyltransferase